MKWAEVLAQMESHNAEVHRVHAWIEGVWHLQWLLRPVSDARAWAGQGSQDDPATDRLKPPTLRSRQLAGMTKVKQVSAGPEATSIRPAWARAISAAM